MAHPRSQEQRARRTATRRGYKLTKARVFDELAPRYDQWTISRGEDVLATVKGLDAVEHELDRLAREQAAAFDELQARAAHRQKTKP